MNYQDFLDIKTQIGSMDGFKPVFKHDSLFDFQSYLVEWALLKGRSALFEDCGLGKTIQQLIWAENVIRKTNKNVLILTPLAVAGQTVREGEKFDIECYKSSGEVFRGITITNYEKLHHFDYNDFEGVVCDESSILKSFNGERKQQITDFMRKVRYRLLCTATAAPNDYIELGTSSEALGELGYMDMLNRFFKNDDNNYSSIGRKYREAIKWRFKGHAEQQFWRWVCSWSRAIRSPSDLGFSDAAFILPSLKEREHIVETKEYITPGKLFPQMIIGMQEQRDERRRTIKDRCVKVAELVCSSNAPALIFCHLNDESDLLEKMIPDGKQVSGHDSDDKKEDIMTAFADKKLRVMITKPKIGAWGLNYQHCSHVVSFPSHSFEQYYQGIRRCWRFGQVNEVVSDIITTKGEIGVMKNLQRKAKAADKMFSEIVRFMNDAMKIDRDLGFNKREEVPSWLS